MDDPKFSPPGSGEYSLKEALAKKSPAFKVLLEKQNNCPKCAAELPEGSEICPNCGYNLKKPISIEEVSDILETTIKHDRLNKAITFLSMLLTYTEEDQINLSYSAESSTGKSYIPLELAWYFPSEDVIEYSYVSPTAFYHEYGRLIDDPTDFTADPEKRRKIREIDLHKKVLIFIDQPHDQLLQRLRPLLSHDRKTLVHKITNRSERRGLRTETVMIIGYPTVLFCSSSFSMEDQEKTRLLILSPETSREKLKDSILLKIEKEGDRETFSTFMESHPDRRKLKERVKEISSSGVNYIIIPEELRKKVSEKFFETHRNLIPRHQRDITRLLAIIKALALLNLWDRERLQDKILVNETDIETGFKLYSQISESNEIGLPPEVYNIHKQIASKTPETGITRKEFQQIYYQIFSKPLGKKRLEEVLNLLTSTGLWLEEPDPNDKRQKILIPTGQGVFISKPENEEEEPQKELISDEEINTPQPVGIQKSDEKINTPRPVGMHSLAEALDQLQDICLRIKFSEGLRELSKDYLFEKTKETLQWDIDFFDRVLKVALRDRDIISQHSLNPDLVILL